MLESIHQLFARTGGDYCRCEEAPAFITGKFRGGAPAKGQTA